RDQAALPRQGLVGPRPAGDSGARAEGRGGARRAAVQAGPLVHAAPSGGRSPTRRDVAAAVDAPVEDVLEAMEAATAYEAVSLDAPRPGTGEEESWTLGEALSDDEHGYELVEIGETLRGTLEALPARERLILRLRFEEDLTQAEIAEQVGVSQMHVSRLLRLSLDRLSAAGAAAA